MSTDAGVESFEKELNRLVDSFDQRLAELKQPGYAEAQLRDDFLNPFFRALGWDMVIAPGAAILKIDGEVPREPTGVSLSVQRITLKALQW